jgi:hypothetical protein
LLSAATNTAAAMIRSKCDEQRMVTSVTIMPSFLLIITPQTEIDPETNYVAGTSQIGCNVWLFD